MILKLTNGNRIIDDRMKSQIFGGADCSAQCLEDCGGEESVRTDPSQDGDSDGKKLNTSFFTP